MEFPFFSKKKKLGIRESGQGLIANSMSHRKFGLLGEAGIGLTDPKNIFNIQGAVDNEGQNINLQKIYDNAYLNFPIVSSSIDIITEQTVQEFFFEGPNNKKITDWADIFNLGHFFSRVVKSMLKNGNCWVEIPKVNGKIVELKILDSNFMATFREGTGKVIGHMQDNGVVKVLWGSTGNPQLDGQVTKRKPLQDMVHFKYNVLDSDKYGTSQIHSVLAMLNIKGDIEQDTKIIVQRYAAPIMHAKVGDNENPASPEDITTVQGQLQDIWSDTEYVTNNLVDINVLGFQGKALQLGEILNHVDSQIIAGLGVPRVLLGMGEGSDKSVAEVQLRSFNRKIKSIQRLIKIEFEDKIIVGQGLGTKEDKLVWGKVEEREKEMDFDMLRGLVKDGLVTRQKANDLLPMEFREKLPEEIERTQAMVSGQQDQTPFQKGSDKIKDNPTDPTLSQKITDKDNRINKTDREIPVKN